MFVEEFLLHIPCVLIFMQGVFLTLPILPSFLCFLLLFLSAEFLLHMQYWFLFFTGVVSLTHPVLALFLSWEFLLHIPCWFHIYLGSFSYTSHAGFPFLWVVSLTHPVAVFTFKWGVSLTHPMLIFFLCGEFLLHIPCCPHIYLGSLCYCYTSRAGFFFSFLSGEFLLHIPCWLHFYRVSFSYASHAGFPFLWVVSITHPVLASFLSGEFLLHIPC